MDRIAAGTLGARVATVGLSLAVSVAASSLFVQFAAADGLSALDILRTALIAISTLWLAWGASQAIVGLFSRSTPIHRVPPGAPIRGRTAILMPVYNEDPTATFSRVAAMDRGLSALGVRDLFDFAILSDTADPALARTEKAWFARMLAECSGEGRMFYRRRASNRGKKAGNIEDFVTRSGGAYAYMLILDADSLMEGETILEMVRRMEAEPDLGLLQTLPKIINARSRFARAMAFSASFFSPVFAAGIAMMQGREGPFWGHNALVRTRAFAACCGLPELSGRAPFGGHILSHDYVEAALLARGGWRVRLDTDLAGSYEEGPENILEHAKRDRRWCQGNLQHAKLLFAPGLKGWSRFVFVQGIMAYVASLIWALFLLASIASPYFNPPPDYFPEPYQLFPVFPSDETSKAIALILGIFGLLILPKLSILVGAILKGVHASFGGALTATRSVLAELALSSVVAPLMLMFQSRSVLQVLLGRDGGWPASRRSDGRLSVREAWGASGWIVLFGAGGLMLASHFASDLIWWLLPIALPMLGAPWLIAWSSRGEPGPVFTTALERAPTPVMIERERILLAWTGETASPAPAMARIVEREVPHHA